MEILGGRVQILQRPKRKGTTSVAVQEVRMESKGRVSDDMVTSPNILTPQKVVKFYFSNNTLLE